MNSATSTNAETTAPQFTPEGWVRTYGSLAGAKDADPPPSNNVIRLPRCDGLM